MSKLFDVAKDMMTQHVWERFRGETFWIPTDSHAIAAIPKHQIRKGLHDAIESKGPLSIRKAIYAGEKAPLYHVCFRWQEPKRDSKDGAPLVKSTSGDIIAQVTYEVPEVHHPPREVKSASPKTLPASEPAQEEGQGRRNSVEEDHSSREDFSECEEGPPARIANGSPSAPPRPPPPMLPPRPATISAASSLDEDAFIFIDRTDGAVTELSLFRSKDLQDVKDVYQTCLSCRSLFHLLDDLKQLQRLMEKMRAHPLWQAVHIAARLGTISYFLRFQKNDPRYGKQLRTACQPEGAYPLHIAVQNNYVDLVRLLLDLGAKAGQLDVSNDANALHYAAYSSAAMVDLLCETDEGKSLINATNKEGYTPVFVALRNGNPLVFHAFVRNGAELNIRCKGRSALFQCLQDNNAPRARQVVAAMVEKSPDMVEEVDPSTGNTGLHAAAGKGALGALLYHVQNKDFIDKKNDSGQTAVHKHTARNDLGAVMALASYGANLNAIDLSRNTPLHFAASKGNLAMVRLLLVLGADPNVINANKDSPRHLAAKLSASETRFLLRIRNHQFAGIHSIRAAKTVTQTNT